MEIIKTEIPEVFHIQPKVFGDDRGFFMETYSRKRYKEQGLNFDFVQDNHSRSVHGVLRGLHYQLNRPQGKLVRVVRGVVFDVAMDIRLGSPTFGKAVWVILSAILNPPILNISAPIFMIPLTKELLCGTIPSFKFLGQLPSRCYPLKTVRPCHCIKSPTTNCLNTRCKLCAFW